MVKPRENRVPIMMSDEELQAIDDWRFQNRVATRSDAVRRLCRIGLLVGAELDGLSDSTLELSGNLSQLDDETFKLWTALANPALKGDTVDRGTVASAIETLLSNISQVGGGVDDVSSILVGLYRAVAGLARAGDLAEGKGISDQVTRETNENLAKMRELRAMREERRRRMSELGYRASQKTEDGDK
ncbi:hypothetical protein GOD62_29410 [Sinorhizobium medicae]|nr:hypothetical protein [Sinorhizobium medicae]MDX0796712.1 hypothetical protein [Sinorhizobium medicae]